MIQLAPGFDFSGGAENDFHELLVAEPHISIAVIVSLLESFSESLYHDTRPNKSIERNSGGRSVAPSRRG